MIDSIRTALLLSAFLAAAQARGVAPLQEFVGEGRFREGAAAYASPQTNAERFSLALLQALDGFQQFTTGMQQFGINPEVARSGLPFFRALAEIPPRPDAAPATPDRVAGLFRNLEERLQAANDTLATLDDTEFGVELNLSEVRLDLNGDGVVEDTERLLDALGPALGQTAGEALVLRCDRADAAWLKGYTHFFLGLLNVFTSCDWMPVWNQCAHLVFATPDPMPPIAKVQARDGNMDWRDGVDMIAALHDMRLEWRDPQGLARARDHFRGMVESSRACWRHALAETDNDREWLPAPAQTGPGGATISQEEIDAWHQVLSELDAVLTGQALLPHWRLREGLGINLDRLVASPPPLDLVLWVQGSALIPYVEEGRVSNAARWESLASPFGSRFPLFAVWVN